MVSAPGSEDLGRGAISDATPSQVKVTLNTQLTVWKSGPDTLLEPEEWSSFSIEGAAMDSLYDVISSPESRSFTRWLATKTKLYSISIETIWRIFIQKLFELWEKS